MTDESKSDASVGTRMDSGVRPRSWLELAAALGIAVVCLRYEGRRWWCGLGDVWPWSGGVRDGHTSQHFVDPYSFTHVLHGVLLYALLRLVAARVRWDIRLVLAVVLECLWEVAENSAMVIGRYRQGGIAQGYEGDSVANSMGDIASCWIGFLLARWLPARWSIALFVVVEVGMLVVYRDNLLLNVIMLIHPSEAVKAWQMGR